MCYKINAFKDFFISGIVFHWGLVLLGAFWMLHLIHLFIKIVSPIWSRKLDRKQTKMVLHVTEVTGAFVLCGLAPIIFLSVSHYSFALFPPIICFPSKEVNFYTMCLPLCIMIGTGVILAIIMFWVLHKVSALFFSYSYTYMYVLKNNIVLYSITMSSVISCAVVVQVQWHI